MFIIGYFLIAIGKILAFVINLYVILIILDAVLSWFPSARAYRAAEVINTLVEPALTPARNLIPHIGIDISPLIAIGALYFIDSFVVSAIVRMGHALL
ncbi:MAG: YggT family protein [Candidatus Marinimicrobia bacterium]|nr:YggT family protein [Candidatus Neomarinimicrobiota bacterium]